MCARKLDKQASFMITFFDPIELTKRTAASFVNFVALLD